MKYLTGHYLFTTFSQKNSNDFQSVTKILKNNLGNDVHFIWALSKDFGSSGFRIGVLYTHNEQILSAYGNINMLSLVSHPMQAIIGELLSDDKYIDIFLDKSRVLLRQSLEIVTNTLDEMSIPYIQAEAGILVYCDFSSLLRDDSFESESELGKLFEDYGRVVMTPGHSQRDNKPGRFRICYAYVTPEVLRVAMSRLSRICKVIRDEEWNMSMLTTLGNEQILS